MLYIFVVNISLLQTRFWTRYEAFGNMISCLKSIYLITILNIVIDLCHEVSCCQLLHTWLLCEKYELILNFIDGPIQTLSCHFLQPLFQKKNTQQRLVVILGEKQYLSFITCQTFLRQSVSYWIKKAPIVQSKSRKGRRQITFPAGWKACA